MYRVDVPTDVYTLSYIIESLSRKKHLHPKGIVEKFGKEGLTYIFSVDERFEMYEEEEAEDDLCKLYGIEDGTFDNITTCRYGIPPIDYIADRLGSIVMLVVKDKGYTYAEAFFEVYTHPFIDSMVDYTSLFYNYSLERLYAHYNHYYDYQEFMLDCYQKRLKAKETEADGN